MLCPVERQQMVNTRDIAHPINSGTREMIQTIILDKYESTLLENEEEALA